MSETNYRGLDDVLVKRDLVLSEVKKNRENHSKQYKEAVFAYRQRVMQEWRERLGKIEAAIDGDLADLQMLAGWGPQIPVPQDHTKDYDRVIKMLEMSCDSELELTSDEFAKYVNDEWDWQQAFTHTVNYLSKRG